MKLPDGWKELKLNQLVKFENGKAHEDCVFEHGKYKLVNSRFISTNGEVVKYSNEARSPLYVDDLTMVMSDVPNGKALASCFLVDKNDTYTLNQRICRMQPIKINSKYLYFYLNRNKYYLRFDNGVGQTNLRKNEVLDCPILYPPFAEQKAIADLLSTWDEAIEKTQRLIQVKEKRFKGYVQRLIDQRCTEWTHIKPKKIFDTITEKNFPDEELLSVTQNRGVIPRSMLEGRVMSPDGTTASYKLIKSGNFAISLRSFQGGIEYSNYQGIISPAYTVLRPKIDINTEFYRHFFKTYIFIEKYLNLAVIGIRDGKQISIPDFMSIKIPVPPLEEQKQIAETLSTIQQEIDLLKQLAEKYKTQKRGLMQKLLTGEWRIKPEILNKYKEA